jgi:hypothetical protein
MKFFKLDQHSPMPGGKIEPSFGFSLKNEKTGLTYQIAEGGARTKWASGRNKLGPC